MAKIKKEYLVSLIALALVAADQVTKLFIRQMDLYESTPLINNIFHITYIQNTGAAFGILHGMNIVLVIVSIIVIGVMIHFLKKLPDKNITKIGFGLVLGGAIGNLIDRIFLGYVVDFLDFRIWPAFNIADSAITIGAVLLVIYYWKK